MPLNGKINYEWNKLRVFINDHDLETFLRSDDHRNVTKNGSQTQKCKECSPEDENWRQHNMIVSYRFCSSVKCHQVEGESCPFRYKIQKCELTKANHVYETLHRHLDRDIDLVA